MKLIFKIAKTELLNLFYSPIAWFLTVAFFVQCAVAYTGNLHMFASRQETGGYELQYLTNLTYKMFSSPFDGIFEGIMKNLYLYIPLLTMGLISREVNAGTISLLYSSPIKVRQIIFGKYLAMMMYSLVLLSVIGFFMIAGAFQIRSVDYGMLLSSALALYLLLCAYSAIGLFMSSLTSYQVVAAISTFVMIGILSYIGTLWQGVTFVRDLTYFLSLSGRTQHMLRGLIITKDLLYFILIIYLFLSFSIYKLKGDQETVAWHIKAGRYVAVLLLVLVVGYFTSRPGLIGYWDTTANKTNTLTPNAQKITRELGDSSLVITAYTNVLDAYNYFGSPTERNRYLANWEPYLRFKPNIEFHFTTYYDVPYAMDYDIFHFYKGKTLKQIAEQQMRVSDFDVSLCQSPAEINREINLKPELNRFVMELRYKNKTTFLRIYNDLTTWPSETEVSAAFKRLEGKNLPKIGFIVGNGERDINKKGDRAYKTMTNEKTFRYALINQGFDTDTLLLDKQDIADNITALVLADPLTPLSQLATQKLVTYIAKGGNLLIAGEPGRQGLLNPLLKKLGVQMADKMLEQRSKDYPPTLVLPRLTSSAIGFSKTLNTAAVDTLPISTNGVAGLTYKDTAGFKVTPLLVTEPGIASVTEARNPDLDMVADNNMVDNNDNRAVHRRVNSGHMSEASAGAKKSSNIIINGLQSPFSSKEDRSKDSFVTTLALTRQVNGKEQRIVVSGDADFMSNGELLRGEPKVSNFYFNTAVFSWLDSGRFPIDTSRPDPKDNRVTVSVDQVTFLKIIYIWALPGLIVIIGAVVLIRRKRK